MDKVYYSEPKKMNIFCFEKKFAGQTDKIKLWKQKGQKFHFSKAVKVVPNFNSKTKIISKKPMGHTRTSK